MNRSWIIGFIAVVVLFVWSGAGCSESSDAGPNPSSDKDAEEYSRLLELVQSEGGTKSFHALLKLRDGR